MIRHYALNATRTTITLLCLFISSVSYAESHNTLTNYDYQMLCSIYKDIGITKSDLPSKEMELAKRIQDNVPIFFNQSYIHIMNASADKRYSLIKQYAKQQSNVDWVCEAARTYYTNEFDNN